MGLHPLNILSICTGGGGLDLGLELALPNACPVCVVEREAFAIAHLVAAMQAGLLAECPVWTDATTFNGREWRGLVDGLIGGIPCQPHSLAGQRGGADDERDLWSDTRRIIAQARPWFVVIENVRGMLTAPPGQIAGAARVRRDLQRLGYAVEGGLFRASEVGASHERERIFILGIAEWWLADASSAGSQGRKWGSASGERDRAPAHGSAAEFCSAPMGNTKNHHRWGEQQEERTRRGRAGFAGADQSLAHADIAELRGEPSARQFTIDEQNAGIGLFPPGPGDLIGWAEPLSAAPQLEPAVCRMADGLAAGVDTVGVHAYQIDRPRMLGNGVVPLQAAYAFRTLVARLAASGSRAAIGLAGMMGVME